VSRQMDQLMGEEIDLNFEIIHTLKILVKKTQWDSNNLKIKLEELLSQHDTIDSELNKIGFYEKPSEGSML
jgi:hypothetical protein